MCIRDRTSRSSRSRSRTAARSFATESWASKAAWRATPTALRGARASRCRRGTAWCCASPT
eukprot:57669-Alexandrium_andersonii.AAC.1